MILLRLAVRSILNRWMTALLTVLAVAASVVLLLGVEKVRTGARDSFANTITDTDLIMGARAGDVQLLLYSVFRVGNAVANVTWESYQDIASRPEVAWIVPLSLGDSHKGFRVLGTDNGYFEHYRYRHGQGLAFTAGGPFSDLFDTIIGAEVAERLGYKLGDPLVVSHGIGDVSFADHADKPFRISGILARTGTPVDRTVHISLEALEAIHVDWRGGSRLPGPGVSVDEVRRMALEPKAATAALIGLKSRLDSFALQRFINEYPEEALSAVLPGVALQQLWGLVGVAETALGAVAAMVVVTALLGMATMVLATLNERRREMAILRSVGATPAHIMGLLLAEAALLVAVGALLGAIVTYGALAVLRPLIDKHYGLYLEIGPPGGADLAALTAVLMGGVIAGLLPAWRAYRLSLADGMTVRT